MPRATYLRYGGVRHMAHDVVNDQLALIQIEGMHCHSCEKKIQKSLSARPGVHEVEVDFNSGQASVLFDRSAVSVSALMDVIVQAGYRTRGFTQSAPNQK